MGDYKDKTGKTRVGSFLQKTAPHLLDMVGDVLPEAGALGILKNIISKDDTISEESRVNALRLLEIDLSNVEGARKMQIAALNQDDLFSKRFVYYIAIFWSLIAASYIFVITFFEVKNARVADTVLGFLLGTIIATIINFFFGSSKGSSDKNTLLSSK